MGTSGVPLNLEKTVIIEAIKKRKGVITHICKDLDITHSTALKYINQDPELEQALNDARHEYDDLLCDVSENTILYCAGQKTDLSAAIKASMFALNNKGKKRGYSPLNSKQDDQVKADDIRQAVVAEDHGATRIQAPSRSLLEDKPPILDQGQPRQQDQVQSELGATAAMGEQAPLQDHTESPTAWYNDVFLPPLA